MKLSLQELDAVESRLSGRVMRLDANGHGDRADLIDVSRRRVQRVRELRMQQAAALDEAATRYARIKRDALERGDPADPQEFAARDAWLTALGIPNGRTAA